MEVIAFVCPLCKGPLTFDSEAYCCDPCGRRYPVVCGIPDFRILPDRFISIEDDRRKGLRLFEESTRRSFAGMLDFYYSITPDVPPALARKFSVHALAEVEIGDASLCQLGASQPSGSLLDVGCSTGGLVVAASRRFAAVIGVDVAFRWLVVGAVRLREAGVKAPLVCANAEFLPFAADQFAAVTATDLVEHLADPAPAFAECRRVAAPGAAVYFSTNNRYSLTPEPHANVWGVGWLPRPWQASYVRLVSRRHYRNVNLRSAAELEAWTRAAGFDPGCADKARVRPAPLAVPGRWERVQSVYNHLSRLPGWSRLLVWFGPRLEILCRK
ncbi:MAG: methyltransferase domain-containing protein [Acidobacteria bacterium]|nr:methyltransferase domain-containing protein [Acidobacteriota bacterium]